MSAVESMPIAAPTSTRPRRLAWLDALRGIAALAVVFEHLTFQVLFAVHTVVVQWIDPGEYGVFVFFLVSGYIVPASLERKGSVRAFWVSRLFRLYPAYLFAIVALVILTPLNLGSLWPLNQHPVTSSLGQLLMMSDLLNTPDVPYTVWTLAYEMVFYLLLTALFTAGVHRRSGTFALGFAAAALGLGGVLPAVAFSGSSLGPRRVALIADVLIICGLALAVTCRRLPKFLGAALAAATGLALATFNSSSAHYPWEAFTILAFMFAGTVLYRAEQGQLPKWQAAVVVVAVFALTLAAGLWHLGSAANASPATMAMFQRKWVITLGLAGITFAAGMALRHRRIPAFLAWLGLVSYSVYLFHPVLLGVYAKIPWSQRAHSVPVQVAVAAVLLAVLLACCAATYRFVEVPAQRLGKRLAGWLEARFGPDRATTPAVDRSPVPTCLPQ
ncbi:MAG TPA: acyltransferase [Streptosporangiaceae bacterium]|nr:acyltransferase [Streptosporangiaceae bacterium]